MGSEEISMESKIYEAVHRHDISDELIKKQTEDLDSCDLDVQDKDGFTALMTEVIRGNIASTELLLMHGAVTEIENDDGCTALSLAIEDSWTTMVDLICRFADVNFVNKHGDTPMALANYYDDEEIIKILRKHGANETDKPARIEVIERNAFG